jgi:hypothetical protein
MKQIDYLTNKYSHKKYKLSTSQVQKLVWYIINRKPVWGLMRSFGIEGSQRNKQRYPQLRNLNVRPKRRRNFKIEVR